MSRLVRTGVRWFHCEDCDHLWDEPCRDAETPSGMPCPNPDCDNKYVLIGPYGYEYDKETTVGPKA